MGRLRSEERPKRRRPGRPRREPYVCGEWCKGCAYCGYMSIVGFCCNYYSRTGKLRDPEEDTRACSVRKELRGYEPPRTVARHNGRSAWDDPARYGSAGKGWMTQKEIAAVLTCSTQLIGRWNWLNEEHVYGRRVPGKFERQFTVEEALRIIRGRRLNHLADPEDLKTPEQLELRERLLAECEKA